MIIDGKTPYAYRGEIFHILKNPLEAGNTDEAYQYFKDGILLVEVGKIKKLGPAAEILPELSDDTTLKSYENSIIMPGFIDNHIHYPQVKAMAAPGGQLLDWLNKYIFPAEAALKDKAVADELADFFLNQLFRSGTTAATVYCSIHKNSVNALFEVAEKYDMCLNAGKVLMDRNGPDGMDYDSPESVYEDSVELIKKWHGKDRFSYVLTPRFAPACSRKILETISKLYQEYPDTYCQTHLSENQAEIAWVAELFPECESYLDVYDKYHLLGKRSLFGHALHLSDKDFAKVKSTGSVLCPCPLANFFLGSGLYKFEKAREYQIRTALGSDIGAGNSFSMFAVMDEAYKMAQLQNYQLSPLEAFYLTTLGNASALLLDDRIGNLEPGKDADFIVVDLHSTPLIEYRMKTVDSLMDKLFVMMMMADDRAIKETYVYGNQVYSRN
jgi:guanine deaminase